MQTHDEVSVEPAEVGQDSADRPRLAHVPGLDGLRGLAVAIVVAYHLNLLPGGFLGVDVFFVLSGYLITSLLLAEVGRTGRVDARRFWGRRVRRLVPAVLVMVPSVIALAWVVRWPRTRLDSLALDAFATLTWWANWRQASGTSYWDADTPSLMRHAWSLAIEEQFYLVWPIVLIGGAVLARKLGRSLATSIGLAATAAFALSSVWHVVLAHRLDATELSRVYVGTDTRVLAPLAGCVLACVWSRRKERPTPSAWVALWGPTAAVASIVLGVMVVSVRVSSPDLYRRGGFVLVALAAMALVAATLAGSTRLTAWSVLRPLRWLGLRSYGIYLWSWPLQVLAEHRFPEAPRSWLVVGVVATSLLVAELSFRLVEDPIRRGLWWAAHRGARRPAWALGVAAAAAAVVATSTYAVEPPVHEQIDTAESASMATQQPPPPPPPPPDGEAAADDQLRVMLTGDSVIWTVGFHLPSDQLPEGIASIDGRAVIGCGLLASDGWLYRSTDPNSPPFVEPAGGACVEQAEAERVGLTGEPDVVLAWPGAWESIDVRSPSGDVLQVTDAEFREVVSDKLVDQALAAHEVGAAFAVVSWSCPGPDAAPERRSPEHLHRMDEIVTDAVERARTDHGVEAFAIEPNEQVCVDADPFGEPTPEKNRAMNNEVHVKDAEGAIWVWHTWLAPALREHLAGRS